MIEQKGCLNMDVGVEIKKKILEMFGLGDVEVVIGDYRHLKGHIDFVVTLVIKKNILFEIRNGKIKINNIFYSIEIGEIKNREKEIWVHLILVKGE